MQAPHPHRKEEETVAGTRGAATLPEADAVGLENTSQGLSMKRVLCSRQKPSPLLQLSLQVNNETTPPPWPQKQACNCVPVRNRKVRKHGLPEGRSEGVSSEARPGWDVLTRSRAEPPPRYSIIIHSFVSCG